MMLKKIKINFIKKSFDGKKVEFFVFLTSAQFSFMEKFKIISHNSMWMKKMHCYNFNLRFQSF